MRRAAIVLVLLILVRTTSIFAMTNDVASAQQIEALKAENEALRKENQALRKLVLVQNKKTIPKKTIEQVGTQVDDVEEVLNGETGYWLSANGVRHNKRCRYYKKAKGKPCNKDSGKPCKTCGG